MNNGRNHYGCLGLWLVLALALAVRLPFILFGHQSGAEIVEYQNLVDNLKTGRGYFIDIKSSWSLPAPVTHYGGYEQSVLPAAILSLLRIAAPRLAAGQLIAPLVFLLALYLIDLTIRREIGPEAASGAGILLALHPGLLEASLISPATATALMAMGLIVWAWFHRNSATLCGLACSIALLAHPAMLAVVVVAGAGWFVQSIREGQFRRFLYFLSFALIGPIWLMVFNRAMGAPLLLIPRVHLFYSLHPEGAEIAIQRAAMEARPLALLFSEREEITQLVLRNAGNYPRALFSPGGLGLLVALVPLAMVSLKQTADIRKFRWLTGTALASFVLAVLCWPVFDPVRLLSMTYISLIIMTAVGFYEVLGREPLGKSGGWRTAAAYVILGVAGLWLAMDAYGGAKRYLEWRGLRFGNQKLVISAGETDAREKQEVVNQLLLHLPALRGGEPKPIVAADDPWLINAGTGLPATRLPRGLKEGQWTTYLEQNKASIVVIQVNTLREPDELPAVQVELAGRDWEFWFRVGNYEVWWLKNHPVFQPMKWDTDDQGTVQFDKT